MANQKFVLLTHGRTGSSLLITALRAAGVAAYGELFHDEISSRSDACFPDIAPLGNEEDGANYIEAFWRIGNGPRGFKLFYEQARQGVSSSIWDVLKKDRDIHIIHLIRHDLLASWTSYEVARRSHVWIQLADEEPPPPLPFKVNLQEISKFFDRIIAQRAWVQRAFAQHNVLEVCYEDDLRDRYEKTICTVLEFIGAGKRPALPPQLHRLSSRALSEQITNFTALKHHFENGPHAIYFSRNDKASGRDGHPGFCTRPFEFLAIDSRGKLRMCCEDWLDTPIGDVQQGPIAAQWNSPTAAAIRQSILDGSYRFCNKDQCPDLVKGSLPSINALPNSVVRTSIRQGQTILESLPHVLSLGYDATCNLKCPTCRSDFFVLKGTAFDQAAQIQKQVIDDLLPGARRIIITGQGDAIASRLYRHFLRNLDAKIYPKLKLFLMSNGLTFDQKMWDSFERTQPMISGVSISIDAATPETYTLNRGGKFEKLMHNLSFISSLLRDGSIDYFELSFVVQANNYHEMPAFIEIARQLGCSSVLFMKLIYWPGTYTTKEFLTRAIHEPSHPEHQELLRILTNPVFNEPHIDLSNLATLRSASLE